MCVYVGLVDEITLVDETCLVVLVVVVHERVVNAHIFIACETGPMSESDLIYMKWFAVVCVYVCVCMIELNGDNSNHCLGRLVKHKCHKTFSHSPVKNHWYSLTV